MKIKSLQKLLLPISFPLSLVYYLIVSSRNFFYDISFLKTKKINDIKVISVGNIKAGGTGKTPIVIAIYEKLSTLGFKVAIITNAYKAHHKGALLVSDGSRIFHKLPIINDETYLIAKKTKAIVVSSKKRELAFNVIAKYNVNFAILDDGLQYRKIEKKLEICIIDKERFFLPFGLLRDSKKSLKRCDKIVCFDGDCQIKAKLEPIGIFDINGKIEKPVSAFVFCAIGNPEKFITTVKEFGIKINGFKFFCDHYFYSQKDINNLINLQKSTKSDILLTTYKDFVKIEKPNIAYIDIKAVLNCDELLRGI